MLAHHRQDVQGVWRRRPRLLRARRRRWRQRQRRRRPQARRSRLSAPETVRDAPRCSAGRRRAAKAPTQSRTSSWAAVQHATSRGPMNSAPFRPTLQYHWTHLHSFTPCLYASLPEGDVGASHPPQRPPRPPSPLLLGRLGRQLGIAAGEEYAPTCAPTRVISSQAFAVRRRGDDERRYAPPDTPPSFPIPSPSSLHQQRSGSEQRSARARCRAARRPAARRSAPARPCRAGR